MKHSFLLPNKNFWCEGLELSTAGQARHLPPVVIPLIYPFHRQSKLFELKFFDSLVNCLNIKRDLVTRQSIKRDITRTI